MRQTIVFGLIAFFGVAALSAEPPQRYSVEIEYTRQGKQLCRTNITAEAGPNEWYVVCGLDGSKNPIMDLRVNVEQMKDSPGQTLVSAKMSEIDQTTGYVKIISNPRIAVLDGETSAVRSAEVLPDGTEVDVMSFSVTVRPL